MLEEQTLTPWLFRRWTFSGPAELYPAILERLRGAPARADELARSLPPRILASAPDGAWSIQRHLGHIADLERLFAQRLDAYEAGVHELPPADMGNDRTVEADHDGRDIADVLAELRRVRAETVARLDAYPRDFFARSAWHARLGVQKRVVDTCQFFADHDDHHLALARLTARTLQGEPNA